MAQDHFERHNHYKGVVDWNFNVVFNGQPAVAAWAEAYKPLLQRPELYEPIPAQWLHATILRVGKLEEYTEEEMLAVAKKVQQALSDIRLPEFHFGTYSPIKGDVVFSIEPKEELEKLYTAITESLESVVGPERATKSPYGHFIAHASLAYTKQQNNEDEIEATIKGADITPATFRVNRMPLIKQHSVNGHYEWEIVKDIVVD